MLKRIDAHRRALAAREDAVALELAQAYAGIADALEPELAAMRTIIEAAGPKASPAWLRRQADYKKLLAGAQAAYLEYGRLASRTIDEQHGAALAYGLRDAGELLRLAGTTPKPLTKKRQGELQGAMRRRLRSLALPRSIAQLGVATLRDTLAKAARGLVELPKLITKVREGLGQILVNVLRAARSESTTAYRTAVGAQFAATGRVVGWQWAAELGKTPAPCPVCVAMHGQTFAADEPFGAHIGCRCLAIPVLEGVGPAIGEQGPAWLARQDEARQVAVLGKTKRRLYASGALHLEQLVEVTDHPVYGPGRRERSLKQLGIDYRAAPAAATAEG